MLPSPSPGPVSRSLSLPTTSTSSAARPLSKMPFTASHATLRKPRRPHSLPAEDTTTRPSSTPPGSSSAPHDGRFKRLLGRKAHEELDFGCAGDEKPEQTGWAAYSMADKSSRSTRSSSSFTSTSTSSSAVPALVHSRAHSSNSSNSSSSHSRTPSSSSTFSSAHSRGHSGSSTYSSSTSASSLPPSPTFSSDPFSPSSGISSSPKKAERRSEELAPLDGLNAYFWGVRLSRVEEDTTSRSASSSPRQTSPQSSPLQSSPRQLPARNSSPPRETSTYGHSRRRDTAPVEFDFEIAYTPTGESTFVPLTILPLSPRSNKSTLFPSSTHSLTFSAHSLSLPSEDLDTELEELSEYFSHPAPRNQVFPSWPHRKTVEALRTEQRRVSTESGRNALRERRVEYEWI